MTSDLTFYNLVDSLKCQDTMESLIGNNVEIVLKVNNQHCRTKILSKRNEKDFLIRAFNTEIYKDEKITCTFEFQRNKFFFKTSLTSNSDGMTISIPKELFQLQRRNDFRMVVPMGIKYLAEIQNHDGQRVKESIELRDISLGGCLVVLKKTDRKYEVNDSLQLKIKILDLDVEHINCKIRHCNLLQNETKVQLGLSFIDPDADFLTDLQIIMIQLDRILRGKKYD